MALEAQRGRLTVDIFIPAALRAEPETLRKARLSLHIAALLVVLSQASAVSYVLRGHLQLAAIAFTFSLLLLFTPLFLRSREPLQHAGTYVGLVPLFGACCLAYYTGGLYSAGVWWMTAVPVLSLLVAGRRAAFLLATAHVLLVAGLWYLHASGHAWPKIYALHQDHGVDAIKVLLLMFGLLTLGNSFEHTKDRMLDALARKNAEMRLVLDNVGQGFLCCDAAGNLVGQHSRAIERWFGELAPGCKIWRYLGADDARFAAWFELALENVAERVLPLELALDQMPQRLMRAGRYFELEYSPIFEGTEIACLVLVVTDVTPVVESERGAAAQRELADVLDRAVRDRRGVLAFLRETDELIADLVPNQSGQGPILHTIKGTTAFFGARTTAEAVHALEGRLSESGEPLGVEEIMTLRETWRSFASRVSAVLQTKDGMLELSAAEYEAVRAAVKSSERHAVIERMLDELQYEPAERVLARAAERARELARRLGKGEIDVQVRTNGIRLDPERWHKLWSAFVHAIRNSVDHGLEAPAEREALGKPARGRLRVAITLEAGTLSVSLEDDGRGVDWQAVAQRARTAGLPHETREELTDALFHSGLSTRDEASETSGRGFGMAALKAAVVELQGRIEVSSEPGTGTRLVLCFPESSRHSLPAPAPRAHVAA
jgi:two-component sensor histidine kinase